MVVDRGRVPRPGHVRGQSAVWKGSVPRLLHAGRAAASKPRREPGTRPRTGPQVPASECPDVKNYTGPQVPAGGAGQSEVHHADEDPAGTTQLRGRSAHRRHPPDVTPSGPRVSLSSPGRLRHPVRRGCSTDPVLPDHQGRLTILLRPESNHSHIVFNE